MLSQIQLEDEVDRVGEERKEPEQRLKRLRPVYLDGMILEWEYRRQKVFLQDQLGSLVVPGVDQAKYAAWLLESLTDLWEGAKLGERRKLLLTMLDAIYVDTLDEKAIVGIQPKPAFPSMSDVSVTLKASMVRVG